MKFLLLKAGTLACTARQNVLFSFRHNKTAKGRSQAVRHLPLEQAFVGSNPPAPDQRGQERNFPGLVFF